MSNRREILPQREPSLSFWVPNEKRPHRANAYRLRHAACPRFSSSACICTHLRYPRGKRAPLHIQEYLRIQSLRSALVYGLRGRDENVLHCGLARAGSSLGSLPVQLQCRSCRRVGLRRRSRLGGFRRRCLRHRFHHVCRIALLGILVDHPRSPRMMASRIATNGCRPVVRSCPGCGRYRCAPTVAMPDPRS